MSGRHVRVRSACEARMSSYTSAKGFLKRGWGSKILIFSHWQGAHMHTHSDARATGTAPSRPGPQRRRGRRFLECPPPAGRRRSGRCRNLSPPASPAADTDSPSPGCAARAVSFGTGRREQRGGASGPQTSAGPRVATGPGRSAQHGPLVVAARALENAPAGRAGRGRPARPSVAVGDAVRVGLHGV